MKKSEGEYQTSDGLKIFYQSWIPDNPKAVVQIVHGFAEHGGRYLNVINELIPLGYAIYADDHRGHGRSEGVQNYADSMEQLVEDQKLFYDIIEKEHPNLPIFMLGHSMGSGIAMYFVKKYESLLNGLVISGSGVHFGGKQSKVKVKLAKTMSKRKPEFSSPSGLDANLLSRDPKAVKAYINDPLVRYKKITARLGWVMIESFLELPNIVNNFDLPVLFQKGLADAAMTGIDELERAFKGAVLTIHEYEGLYHEIYNELEEDRKVVLKDLSNWLEKQV